MMIPSLNKQYYLLGSCIGLAFISGFTFFYSLWQWSSDWELAYRKPSYVAPLLKENSIDIATVLPRTHVFGQAITSGTVPITNLQLRITGIVLMDNNEYHTDSKAYISMGEQMSKAYRIGDTIADRVKIYDITPDAVILENDKQIEKLPLPREKLTFKPRSREML